MKSRLKSMFMLAGPHRAWLLLISALLGGAGLVAVPVTMASTAPDDATQVVAGGTEDESLTATTTSTPAREVSGAEPVVPTTARKAVATPAPTATTTATAALETAVPPTPPGPERHTPQFNLSCADATLTTPPSSTVGTRCTLRLSSTSEFSAVISCSPGPTGNPGCTASPTRVTVPPGGAASTEIAITVGELDTPDGRWPVKIVTNKSQSDDQKATITLAVPDFRVQCSGSTTVWRSGTPSPVGNPCEVKSLGGFGGSVQLGCSGAPAGTSCSPNPSQLTVAPDGSASFELDVDAADDAVPGNYTLTVTGTSGGRSHSTTRVLTVN